MVYGCVRCLHIGSEGIQYAEGEACVTNRIDLFYAVGEIQAFVLTWLEHGP